MAHDPNRDVCFSRHPPGHALGVDHARLCQAPDAGKDVCAVESEPNTRFPVVVGLGRGNIRRGGREWVFDGDGEVFQGFAVVLDARVAESARGKQSAPFGPSLGISLVAVMILIPRVFASLSFARIRPRIVERSVFDGSVCEDAPAPGCTTASTRTF